MSPVWCLKLKARDLGGISKTANQDQGFRLENRLRAISGSRYNWTELLDRVV